MNSKESSAISENHYGIVGQNKDYVSSPFQNLSNKDSARIIESQKQIASVYIKKDFHNKRLSMDADAA
jgi:hypothetical protein